MYLRFTILRADQDSHHPQGVLQAAFELRDSGVLAAHEERELLEALAWLKMHLKSPACLRDDENRRALSWFKPAAKKPIEQVRRLISVLQEHGHLVEMHKSDDPGVVLYEDGWQVVAKPQRRSVGS